MANLEPGGKPVGVEVEEELELEEDESERLSNLLGGAVAGEDGGRYLEFGSLDWIEECLDREEVEVGE